MIVMLDILFCSFMSALCYTFITAVATYLIRRDWESFCERLPYIISSFVIEAVYMMVFLYVSCKPQTILIALIWMWPALIANFVISLIGNGGQNADIIVSGALLAISGILCMAIPLGPVQNLIYVHDMENVDLTYVVSSDEILAKMELKIDNVKWREKYVIESPEMRQVNSENVAVYHIKDAVAEGGNGNTEYIPGYAIQKEGEMPEIISKRIYFDTSYTGKKDALRTIRRKYPTVVIGDCKFDIDDNWTPYMIYEYRENLFSSNGEDYGLIILNLMDGTCEKYPISENKIPTWVDFTTTYPR